jgi:PAS domain S-box-containing protein
MLGYEPDEFPAGFESWRDLIHPEDLDAAMSVAQTYLANKPDRYENEFRRRTSDGCYRWIHATARVVERDEDGDAVRMIGNHQVTTQATPPAVLGMKGEPVRAS